MSIHCVDGKLEVQWSTIRIVAVTSVGPRWCIMHGTKNIYVLGRIVILSKEYGRVATVLDILFQCPLPWSVLEDVAVWETAFHRETAGFLVDT